MPRKPKPPPSKPNSPQSLPPGAAQRPIRVNLRTLTRLKAMRDTLNSLSPPGVRFSLGGCIDLLLNYDAQVISAELLTEKTRRARALVREQAAAAQANAKLVG